MGVLFGLSSIAFLVMLLMVRMGLLPDIYPFNNPLFQGVSYQADFDCFIGRFHHFRTEQFFTYPSIPPFTYPAPVALLYDPFFVLFHNPHHSHYAYLAVCALGYVVAAGLFARALTKRGISQSMAAAFAATVLLTSYPAALQFYLANVEGLMWLFVLVGVWAWYCDKHYLAAACFGLATSMKIFPFVYFGLLLPEKKYKQIAFGILVLAVTSFASLWLLGPTLHQAAAGIRDGLAYFQKFYVDRFNLPESGMDHSLFAVLKRLGFRSGALHGITLHRVSGPFQAAEALAGIGLYFPRIYRLPRFNRLLVLAIASVVLPLVSHDYTLLHLYAPWAMLVLLGFRSKQIAESRPFTAMLCCFALLFTSQGYLLFHEAVFAGQFKCITLIVLGWLALRYPFADGATDTGLIVEPLAASA